MERFNKERQKFANETGRPFNPVGETEKVTAHLFVSTGQ